jgi:biotin carboxyl carrier protein
MKRYIIILEDQAFDVTVLGDPREERVRVEVDGEVFDVGVEAAPVVADASVGEVVSTGVPSATPKLSGATGNTVVAPLPGVIKSIAVRPGQEVAPDDELFVIEAMKMDNVIRATRVGTIGAIHVSEGRQVAYGEPMLDYAD